MNFDSSKFQDISNIYGTMQNICQAKCIQNINKPTLNPGEQDCLYRCAFKFKEALDFGMNTVTFIDYSVDKFQTQPQDQNNLLNTQPTTARVSGMKI